MHVTKCLEIWVKFRGNHSGQHITYRNGGDTRTQCLRVEHDALRLHVAFVDKDGDEIGSINFNSAEVLEYSMEGYVR